MNTKIAELTNKATQKELKDIKIFHRRAIELSNNSLIRNGYKLRVGLQISSEDGPSYDIESLPSEESFRSLLLGFRHFWMKKEDPPLPPLGSDHQKYL